MRLGEIDLKRTVVGFELPSGAVYASNETIGDLPIRQLVGFELADVTLRCRWHQQLLDIWETHDAVELLKETGEEVELTSDDGGTWGSYIVMKVVLRPTKALPDESIIEADVEITLGDPGNKPDVVVKPKPIAVTGVDGAETDEVDEDRSVPPADVPVEQIARRQ